MPAPRIVTDALSPLSHKELIGLPGDTRNVAYGPTWVPETDQRRLNGYHVLDAYTHNTARLTLPANTPDADRRLWREYGDPAAFLDRLVAAILGDGWTITVDGADEDLSSGPLLGDRPDPAPDGAAPDSIEARVANALLDAWTAGAEEAFTEWETALAVQPALLARQSAVRDWADTALLAAHLDEGEHNATGLGDAVYVLWPSDGGWPTVEVYHPGFYFPELGDDDRGEYPTTVHLAWEFYEPDGFGRKVRRIRRLTWQLVPVVETRFDHSTGAWLGLDGDPLDDGEPFPLRTGDIAEVRDGDVLRRRYPWTPQGTETSALPELTCVFSNGTWDLADVHDSKVDALSDSAARWDVYRQDLLVPFLPVVHVPDTPTGSEHFGRSALLNAAQLLDDIAQIDTRTMTASEFLGLPTAAVSGAKVDPGSPVALRAGTAIGLGDSGRMDMLDLSASVERLFELGDRLADRLLAMLGAPREVMGRVDETTASGVHLLIKYLPWAQVIGSMRLPREPKMRLLLKFAQRLAQVQGALEAGPTPVARIRYGSFLPMNRAEVVEIVTKAVEGRVMSRGTALRLLIAAGLPVNDAAAELEAIRADDTEAAKNVADATGSESLAAERLGVELPEPPAGPTVTLP